MAAPRRSHGCHGDTHGEYRCGCRGRRRELVDFIQLTFFATIFVIILIDEGKMSNLKGLETVVYELRAERTNLSNQLRTVDAALSVLSKLNGGSSAQTSKRTVSASARRKMSLAQKARWAKQNNQAAKPTLVTTTPKRRMSASARKKIAAFQRARWAKLKAGNKAA
jgi:hypothetical protein